jgi:hypothetical protein
MPATAPVALEPLPVARPSERVFDRARGLRAEGRPRDALRALGTIDLADPLRPAADALRAAIQREILAGLSEVPAVTTPEVSR